MTKVINVMRRYIFKKPTVSLFKNCKCVYVMNMAKIYTKTGDKGETRLVSGEKVSKAHLRLEAYGTVDELNSTIGVACSQIDLSPEKEKILTPLQESLFQIQNALFNIGSQLACNEAELSKKLPNVSEGDVLKLEQKIDELEVQLTPLKNFILPGGTLAAAQFHICRTVCRRAERLCIRLQVDGTEVSPVVIQYLNRLSDLFFVMSRFCNHIERRKEIEWKSK